MKKYLFVSLVVLAVFSGCTSLVQTAYTDDLYYVPGSVAVSNNKANDSINVVDNRDGLTYTKEESYDGFADARNDNYISDNSNNFSDRFESDNYCSRLRFFHNSYFYDPYYFSPLDVDPWFFSYYSYRPYLSFGFNYGGWDMYWGFPGYYSYDPFINPYYPGINAYWMGFYNGYYYGSGFYNYKNYTSILTHRRGINHYSRTNVPNNRELVVRNKQRIGKTTSNSASMSINTVGTTKSRIGSVSLVQSKTGKNSASATINTNNSSRITTSELAKSQLKSSSSLEKSHFQSRLTVNELVKPVKSHISNNRVNSYNANKRSSLNKIVLNNKSIGNVRVNKSGVYRSNNSFYNSNNTYRRTNSGFSNNRIGTSKINTYNRRISTKNTGSRVIRARSNSSVRNNYTSRSSSSNTVIKSSSSKSSNSGSGSRRRR